MVYWLSLPCKLHVGWISACCESEVCNGEKRHKALYTFVGQTFYKNNSSLSLFACQSLWYGFIVIMSFHITLFWINDITSFSFNFKFLVPMIKLITSKVSCRERNSPKNKSSLRFSCLQLQFELHVRTLLITKYFAICLFT